MAQGTYPKGSRGDLYRYVSRGLQVEAENNDVIAGVKVWSTLDQVVIELGVDEGATEVIGELYNGVTEMPELSIFGPFSWSFGGVGELFAFFTKNTQKGVKKGCGGTCVDSGVLAMLFPGVYY